MQVSEFINKWLRVLPVDYYKPSTLANYQSHIKQHILPHFGSRELESVTVLDIQEYIVLAQKSGLSNKSVRNILMTMRVLWKSALAWQLVKFSPFFGLMLPRVHTTERVSFSMDEIKRIIDTARPPYNLFFWLAAETGMRAGELCGLRMEDVNGDNSTVFVRQSIWSGRVQLPKTKNAIRACVISPELAQALRVFIVQSGAMGKARMRFLFTTVRGYPWNPSDIIERGLHPVLDALGLPRTGLHAFRHSSATLADSFGLPIKDRQLRLGHADARITLDTYTHASTSHEQEKFAAWMGKKFSGGIQ